MRPYSRYLRRTGAILLLCCAPVWAQLAQKPSYYEQQKRAAELDASPSTPNHIASGNSQALARPPAKWRREPTAPLPPDAADSLPALSDAAAFKRMMRVYDAGTPMEIQHLLFAIDLRDPKQLYYINTRRFQLHEDFVRAKRLVPDTSRAALNRNYDTPTRHFLFGTLAWQNNLRVWTYEFWEGDTLSPEMLQTAQTRLQASFFAPLRFKTNSTHHEAIAQQAGLTPVTQAELLQNQSYLPLNTGTARGRLRLVRTASDAIELEPTDIAVLADTPLSLPPVAGVVTAKASTTLSHVNLLAKGWGIPNAYVQEALQVFADLQGQWVKLEVERTNYHITADTPPAKPARTITLIPAPRLQAMGLLPLARLRAPDRQHCGSKATNLGTIAVAQHTGQLTGVAPVPDGFCIPFIEFADFMRSDAVRQRIAQAEATSGFATMRSTRRDVLERLRRELIAMPLPEAQTVRWTQQWRTQLGGQGVFVRSSSNSEDLPNFSGAGLYDTVPNVTDETALAQAVKTVWASVFNLDAWEARQWAGVPHDLVVMGVFVQHAVPAQSAGVMITAAPFDATHQGATFIAAKRGLGIRVVEGQRQAEEVLYSQHSRAVQVLSRSADATALALDARGGVREESTDPARAVLDDTLVRRLAQAGERIEQLFGSGPQDIEWATDAQGQIMILQARPFIVRHRQAP